MFDKYFKKIENSKKSLIFFVILFFVAVTLRNFIEPFSTKIGWKLDAITQWYLFYVSLVLAIILLFYFLTKEKLSKLTKIILPGFFILILAPIIDLIITGGYELDYLFPGHDNLLANYLSFCSFATKISLGLKIEVALVLFLSFFYFLYKTKNYLKSILGIFCLYSLIFLYGATPFVLNFFKIIGAGQEIMKNTYSGFFLFSIFILLGILFFLYSKKIFIAILKNFRPLRQVHYWLMVVLGTLLAGLRVNLSAYFFNFIFVIIAIIFIALFSIIVNDIEDINIDKISNPDRPLVKKTISISAYKKISWMFLFLALLYSIFAGPSIFFLLLIVIISYYVYSAPPLKLKRIPFFSKIVIGFNSLLLILVGYNLAGGNILTFPKSIALFVLISFTACANFIDIKDYKGDEKVGIKTLPGILGLETSKKVIGSFFLITYILFPFLVNRIILLPMAIFLGTLLFITINKKIYNEKTVFLIHLLSLAFLIIYFTFIPLI